MLRIHELIKEHLRKNRMKYTDLARATGIDQGNMHRIINHPTLGKRMTVQTALKLIYAMGLDSSIIEQLYWGIDEPTRNKIQNEGRQAIERASRRRHVVDKSPASSEEGGPRSSLLPSGTFPRLGIEGREE